MKRSLLYITLAITLYASGHAKTQTPSDVRIKSLEGIITFRHSIHLRMGIRDCDSCHRWIKEGKNSVHKHCRGCHVDEKVGPTQCHSCHKT